MKRVNNWPGMQEKREQLGELDLWANSVAQRPFYVSRPIQLKGHPRKRPTQVWRIDLSHSRSEDQKEGAII